MKGWHLGALVIGGLALAGGGSVGVGAHRAADLAQGASAALPDSGDSGGIIPGRERMLLDVGGTYVLAKGGSQWLADRSKDRSAAVRESRKAAQQGAASSGGKKNNKKGGGPTAAEPASGAAKADKWLADRGAAVAEGGASQTAREAQANADAEAAKQAWIAEQSARRQREQSEATKGGGSKSSGWHLTKPGLSNLRDNLNRAGEYLPNNGNGGGAPVPSPGGVPAVVAP